MEKTDLYKILEDYSKYNNKSKINGHKIEVTIKCRVIRLYLGSKLFFNIDKYKNDYAYYSDRVKIYGKIYYLEDILKIIYDSIINDKEKRLEDILKTLESRQEIYNRIDKELKDVI